MSEDSSSEVQARVMRCNAAVLADNICLVKNYQLRISSLIKWRNSHVFSSVVDSEKGSFLIFTIV